MRALAALLLCTVVLGHPVASAGGSIRGMVVDSMDAIIPGATIRLLDNTSRNTMLTAHADKDGRFEVVTPDDAGRYLLVISSKGFSDELISLSNLEFQTITMRPQDCDAPGVVCDIFSSTSIPPDPNPVSRANLVLNASAAIDLNHSKSVPQTSNSADLQLTESAGALYLAPLHETENAASCGLNAPAHNAGSRTAPFRIDGLGPRSQLCFKTRAGRLSKVFLIQEIHPGDKQVRVSVVTRAR